MVMLIHGVPTLPVDHPRAEIFKPVPDQYNGIKIAEFFPEQLMIGND
jgi:hypothetical protein